MRTTRNNRHFEDRRGKPPGPGYDWQAFTSWNLLQRYWKNAIAKKVWAMAGNPPPNILDIGCGSSPIITYFPEAIGVDIDEGKLGYMRTKIDNELIRMDAHSLSFADNSFDLVLFIETIEHLSNPDKAMSEISRVLRNDGRAIIATPDNSKVLWRIIQWFYDKLMTGAYEEQHTSLFTRDGLIQAANRHNLSLAKMEYVGGCDMVALFSKEAPTTKKGGEEP